MQLCLSLVISNCIYIFVNNLYSSYLVLGGNLAHCPFLLCQLVWMLSCINLICCSTLTKQPQAVFKRSIHPQIIWQTHNTHCYSNYVVVFSLKKMKFWVKFLNNCWMDWHKIWRIVITWWSLDSSCSAAIIHFLSFNQNTCKTHDIRSATAVLCAYCELANLSMPRY